MMEARFGNVRVIWGEDGQSKLVHTKFPDGTYVNARPIDEPWEHTAFRHPLHSWLANYMGLPHSPYLYNIANPDPDAEGWRLAYEQTAVMSIQNYLIKIGMTPERFFRCP